MSPPNRLARSAVLIALACLCATGCVRRRLLVRSNPPGATVFVDNQPIGVTPCGVDFVYYGTREIRLSKPGYETLTVNQPIPTPVYELPGIDFVSEVLLPTRIKDERVVSYNLARTRMAPAEEIIGRAEMLRNQATPIGVAPLGAPTTAGFASPLPPPAAPATPPIGSPSMNSLPPMAPTPLSPTTTLPPTTTTPMTPLSTPPSTPPSAGAFRY